MRKTRLLVTLGIIAIIVAGLLLAAGCTGGEAGSGSGVRFIDLTSLTKLAPDEATMMIYADMKAIMEDTDLGEMYENMEAELDEANELGITPSSVKHFGIIVVDNDEITVVGADLDLDLIHAKLAEEGSTSEDYLGFEVWLGGNDMAWAIMDDTLLIGSEDGVKACLIAINSGATAYAGSQDIRDTLDRMSDGVMTMLMTGDQFYPGSLYAGITIDKISSEGMKMVGLIKFANDDEATDVEAEMKASMDMEEMAMLNMSVSRSGSFVEFSADIDMGEGMLPW